MVVAQVTISREEGHNSVAYVLDDDGQITALVARMLRAADFVAIPFNDPDQCLSQLKAADAYSVPTIFILDLSLGSSDGIEVLNQLRNQLFKGRVLLISGKDESALSEVQRMGQARGLRMLPPLKKPFGFDDLKERLAAQIDPASLSSTESATRSPKGATDRAVSSGRLALRYQGIYEAKSGSMIGAEVVVYEQHESGRLMPLTTAFEPSQAAIYHPLSRLLIRTMTAEWGRHLPNFCKPFRLAIRLPLSAISTPGFLDTVRKYLAPHVNFPRIVIGVNDWALFNDLKGIREASAQLALYNIALSVNDVGAVYSATMKAYKFPFVELRLTADWVSNCGLNETKGVLCKDIIDLVHGAGATVCPEGVMDRSEFKALVEMRCDMMQGYLFGEPQFLADLKAKLLPPSALQKATDGTGTDSAESFEWPEVSR